MLLLQVCKGWTLPDDAPTSLPSADATDGRDLQQVCKGWTLRDAEGRRVKLSDAE